MNDSEHKSTAPTLKAVALGAAIGATTAVLVTPRNGKETRAQLRHTGESWRGRIEKGAEEIQRGATDMQKRFTAFTHDSKKKVDKTTKQAKKELDRTKKSVKKSAKRVAKQTT